MQVDGPVATGRGVHPSCGSERGEDKDECGRQGLEDGVRQGRGAALGACGRGESVRRDYGCIRFRPDDCHISLSF